MGGRKPTFRYVNLDRSVQTPADLRRQAKAFRRLRQAGVDPGELERYLWGRPYIHKCLRAIQTEREALEKDAIWREVSLVARHLQKALEQASRTKAISDAWQLELWILATALTEFVPDPVHHDPKRAAAEIKRLKIGFGARASSLQSRQQSRFAGEFVRSIYSRIAIVGKKNKKTTAELTQLFLSSTCPSIFAELTSEQVRRRVAHRPTP